jgi:hypothetical protein
MDLIAGAIAQSTIWAISSIVIVKATTPKWRWRDHDTRLIRYQRNKVLEAAGVEPENTGSGNIVTTHDF